MKNPDVDCFYCKSAERFGADLFGARFALCPVIRARVPINNAAPPSPCKHFDPAPPSELMRRFPE